MRQYAYFRASGMFVPEEIVTNDDLAETLDTSDEWIQQRSGIRERRYAKIGIRTSDLAKEAVLDLVQKSHIALEEIDCIVFATLSSDIMFPGGGMFLQEKLGLAGRLIPCYDVRAQCSGFMYGLQMAQSFVESGMYQNVLLVGSEIHSHALDHSPRGRSVSVLFGDGAAAVLVSRAVNDQSRILYTENHGDGRGALSGIHMKLYDIGCQPLIYYDPSDPAANEDMYPAMPSSKNLFSNAVRRMTEVSQSVLQKMNMTVDDVNWVLPHQANIRINNMTAEQLGIPKEKVLFNIQKYGNTTAATIPLLLSEFTDNNTIKRGDLLLLVAFGSGFTWGAGLVRY